MKSFYFIILLVFALLHSEAAIYTNSPGSAGQWTVGGTWTGGIAPSADLDSVVITNGIVYYDADNSAMSFGWSNVVIQLNGQLIVTNAYNPSYFLVYSNISGVGTWNVGTSNTPIDYTPYNTPGFVTRFSGKGNCTISGAGKSSWYGNPSHLQHQWLSNSIAIGDISINLSNSPTGITNGGTNCVVWIGESGTFGSNRANAYYVLSSISGTTLNLQTNLAAISAITNNWPGLVLTNTSIIKATTNAPISFLEAPIVFIGTNSFTVATSNTVTGVLFQNRVGFILPLGAGWQLFSNVCINSSLFGNTAITSLCIGNTYNKQTIALLNHSVVNGCWFENHNSTVLPSCYGQLTCNNILYNSECSLLGAINNAIISNNLVLNTVSGLGSSQSGFGSSSGNRAIYNTIINTSSGGFMSDGGGNADVLLTYSNNYVINSSIFNIAVGTFLTNCVVNNNVFSNCSLTLVGGNIAAALDLLRFTNNIFYNCRTICGTVVKRVSFYNNSFINCTNTGGLFGLGNSNSVINSIITNCSNFGIATGTGSNSVIVGNLFINSSISSPAIGTGSLLTNNQFINTTNSVALINAVSDVIFSGNLISNCTSFLLSTNSSDLFIYNNLIVGSSVLSLVASARLAVINNDLINCTNSLGFFINGGTSISCSGNIISNSVGSLVNNASGVTISDTINAGTGGWPLTTNCFDAKLWNSPSTNDSKLLSVPYSTVSYGQSYWHSDYGEVLYTNNQYKFTISTNQPVPCSFTFSIMPMATRTVQVIATSTNNCTYEASLVTGTGYPYNQQIFCTGTSGGTSNYIATYTNNNNWEQVVTLWVDAYSISNTVGYANVYLGQSGINTIQ